MLEDSGDWACVGSMFEHDCVFACIFKLENMLLYEVYFLKDKAIRWSRAYD